MNLSKKGLKYRNEEEDEGFKFKETHELMDEIAETTDVFKSTLKMLGKSIRNG